MLHEPPEPIEGGAIERYLDGVGSRLQPLNDPEGADAILAEFHAHLLDAVEDLVEGGHTREEAERLALERFGTRQAEEIAVSMAERAGQGDVAWRNVGVGFAGLVVFVLGLATRLDLVRSLDVAIWFPVFFSSTLLFYSYACLKSRTLPILRHTIACAGILMALAAMTPLPEAEPAQTVSSIRSFGHGPRASILVASTDVEGIRSLMDVIQRDPRAAQGITSDARRLALENAARRDGPPGEETTPWGKVGGKSFRAFTDLITLLPLSCQLGAIWLMMAGMVRATCSWVCRLGTWSSARPGVWVA